MYSNKIPHTKSGAFFISRGAVEVFHDSNIVVKSQKKEA